jgi:hypothetical protein
MNTLDDSDDDLEEFAPLLLPEGNPSRADAGSSGLSGMVPKHLGASTAAVSSTLRQQSKSVVDEGEPKSPGTVTRRVSLNAAVDPFIPGQQSKSIVGGFESKSPSTVPKRPGLAIEADPFTPGQPWKGVVREVEPKLPGTVPQHLGGGEQGFRAGVPARTMIQSPQDTRGRSDKRRGSRSPGRRRSNQVGPPLASDRFGLPQQQMGIQESGFGMGPAPDSSSRRESGSVSPSQLESTAASSGFSPPSDPVAMVRKRRNQKFYKVERAIDAAFQTKGEVAKNHIRIVLGQLDKILETENEFVPFVRLKQAQCYLRLAQSDPQDPILEVRRALRLLDEVPEKGDLAPDKCLLRSKCYLTLSYKEKNQEQADAHVEQALKFAMDIPNDERISRNKPNLLVKIYLRLSYSEIADTATKAENARNAKKYAEEARDAELIRKADNRSHLLENVERRDESSVEQQLRSKEEREKDLLADPDPESQARGYLKLSQTLGPTSPIEKSDEFAEKALRAAEKIEPNSREGHITKVYLITSSTLQLASSLRPAATKAGNAVARENLIKAGQNVIEMAKKAEENFGKDNELLKIQARGHEFCARALENCNEEGRRDRVYHAEQERKIGDELGNFDIKARALWHLSSAETDVAQKKFLAMEAAKVAANTKDQSLKNRVESLMMVVSEFFDPDAQSGMVQKSEFGRPGPRHPALGYPSSPSRFPPPLGMRQPQVPRGASHPIPSFNPQNMGMMGTGMGPPPNMRQPGNASRGFPPSETIPPQSSLQPMNPVPPFAGPPNISNVSQPPGYAPWKRFQAPGRGGGR